MTEKMTKRDYYNAIKEQVADNADFVAFIDHEIALLNKKNSATKKPTKVQIANEAYKDTILASLTDKMTVGEINKAYLPDLSAQKVSALVAALVKAGKLVRTEIKRVAYFAVAE